MNGVFTLVTTQKTYPFPRHCIPTSNVSIIATRGHQYVPNIQAHFDGTVVGAFELASQFQ
jgi:hypothetical protein